MTAAEMIECPVPALDDPSLDAFCDELFVSLPRSDQRRWARTYLRGLVRLSGRKSIRRICDLVARDEVDQCLQQFLNQSPWDWEPVRRTLAQQVARARTPRAWVLGEAVLPKNGRQSVGVARQYAPSAERLVNCQIGLSLSLATDSEALSVDWRLALPRCWDTDRFRRSRTGVPDDETHRPRWSYLSEMLDEVDTWNLRTLPVVADFSGTHRLEPVLRTLEQRRLSYLVRVPVDTTVAVSGRPVRLSALATPGNGQQTTTRESFGGAGPERTTTVSVPLHGMPGRSDDGRCGPRILACRRPGPQSAPDAVYLANTPGQRLTQQLELVRLGTPVTRGHQRLLDDSGLGDFEGRSFRGWHHHVTLVSAAHAFRSIVDRDH